MDVVGEQLRALFRDGQNQFGVPFAGQAEGLALRESRFKQDRRALRHVEAGYDEMNDLRRAEPNSSAIYVTEFDIERDGAGIDHRAFRGERGEALPTAGAGPTAPRLDHAQIDLGLFHHDHAGLLVSTVGAAEFIRQFAHAGVSCGGCGGCGKGIQWVGVDINPPK